MTAHTFPEKTETETRPKPGGEEEEEDDNTEPSFAVPLPHLLIDAEAHSCHLLAAILC